MGDELDPSEDQVEEQEVLDTSNNDQDQDEQKPEGEEDKKPEAPTEDDDDDIEPPVREKSKKDYIIERQQKKIEKMKKAKDSKPDTDFDDEDDDEDISPEDEKMFNRFLRKKYGSSLDKLDKLDQLDEVLQSTQRQADEMEIKQTLEQKPELKEFEAKARKFWEHPSRNHLPFLTVLYEVAGDALLKTGAKMERKASNEEKKNKVPGGTSRGSGGSKKSVSEMSDEEFMAEKARVLGHR